MSASPVSPQHPADEVLVAFAAALRSAGLPVTLDRTRTFLEACALVGAGERSTVFWAGRACFCANPDDLDRYGLVFASWFGGEQPRPPATREAPPSVSQADLGDGDGAGDGMDEDVLRVAASAAEVLRSRDIAALGAAERAILARMFGSLRVRIPLRASARLRPSRRGQVDARRTLRDELRRGGEPVPLRYRDLSVKPRRVVILIDVSGSMRPYADSLLRWAHVVTAANRSHTEVFTIGTRLTRVTRAMRLRDSEAALEAAGRAVPDWSGGTRLGEALQAFVDRWGRRGVARGAVVVVMSDGWERGDCRQLAEQMSSLKRLAHRVIWVNPHRGKAGYAPVQSGMVAALPYVDDFIAGHSLTAFEEALEVMGRA